MRGYGVKRIQGKQQAEIHPAFSGAGWFYFARLSRNPGHAAAIPCCLDRNSDIARSPADQAIGRIDLTDPARGRSRRLSRDGSERLSVPDASRSMEISSPISGTDLK